MRAIAITIGLLCISNVFMTFAWYAHLKELINRPWFIAVLVSWGIALFEYTFQVPANRMGFTVLSVAQLKILQEVWRLSRLWRGTRLPLNDPSRAPPSPGQWTSAMQRRRRDSKVCSVTLSRRPIGGGPRRTPGA